MKTLKPQGPRKSHEGWPLVRGAVRRMEHTTPQVEGLQTDTVIFSAGYSIRTLVSSLRAGETLVCDLYSC